MLLGEIHQSVEAWQKLSGINLRAGLSYKLLKYTKLVSAENVIFEKQKAASMYEVTGVQVGQPVRIEQDDPTMKMFAPKYQEILLTESDLKQLDMDFEEVVNAVDEKDETLTINDLAMLEPFFSSCDCECEEDTCGDK